MNFTFFRFKGKIWLKKDYVDLIKKDYANSHKPIVFLDFSRKVVHFYYRTPEGEIFDFGIEDKSVLLNLQKVDD